MAHLSAVFTPDIPHKRYGDVMTQHVRNSISNRLVVLLLAALATVFYTLYRVKQCGRQQP